MVPIQYIYRNLGRRKLRTTMTVLGIALVVAIYVAMSSVADAMVKSFRSTGTPEEIVVTRAGSMAVDTSTIERSSLTYLQTLEGVAHQDGKPLVSPELWLGCVVRAGNREAEMSVRGITEVAPLVYRQVRIVEGNWPSTARGAVLGLSTAGKLGLGIGSDLEFEGASWTVEGLLSAGGRVYDQEIWVDLDDLAAASNRKTYTSYTLRTKTAETVAALTDTINEGRQYPLASQPAARFYAQTGAMSIVMAQIGTFIALVISIGAVFGGMNTMYSAVANRRREIGILRALGFGGGAVLTAFLLESIAIALLGGLVGLLFGFGLSLIPVDLPFLSQSPGSIGLDQIWQAFVLVLTIGILGGGLPTIRAARLRVIAALR